MEHPHRQLTYDEKKAAEAAFRGAPFDPTLSESARKVYNGLSSAIAKQRHLAFQDISLPQPVTNPKKSKTELLPPSRVNTVW